MTTASPSTSPEAATPEHGYVPRKKTDHQIRNMQLIAASYLVDGFVLWLFHLAGTITWVPVLSYTCAGLLVCGGTIALVRSGLTRRLEDPGITLPFAVLNHVVQLAAMALFPEVSFMFALVLFIVYMALAMSLRVMQALVAWVLVCLCTGVALALAPSPMQIPDGSLAEQLIAMLFFTLTLWRCALVGRHNSTIAALLKRRGRELAALTEQVDQLAHRDELTGVMNRRSLLQALRDEMQRAERSRQPLCVGILDLDKFKAINDTLGHLAGDKTLRIFAGTLAEHTRQSDRFGRYGGEEFLLVMAGTDTHMASVPIDRMRDALTSANWRDVGPGVNVTFSCGIAEYRPGESTETLLQRADDALYRAKADGRNCTRFG